METSAELLLRAKARRRRAEAEGKAAPMPTPAAAAVPTHEQRGLPLPGTANTTPYVPPTFMDQLLGALDYADNTGAIAADRMREGASNLAGLPVELINISPMLANLFGAENGPMSDYPIGGMEFMNDLTKGFGAVPDAPQPADPFQTVVGRVGEEVGGTMLPVGGILAKAMSMGLPAVRRGSSLTKMFLEQAAVDPAKFIGKETGAAVAAGTGAGIANTMVDRDTTGGRAADLGGAMAGVGIGSVATGLSGGIKDLFAAATGSPKYSSDIVRQNAADTLIRNSDVLGAQVDPMNPNVPIDTQALADLVMRGSAAEGVIPGFKASTADRAGDFGLASLENARSKGDNAGRFRARQDANTTAIDQRLQDVAPTESPAVFRTALDDERDRQLVDAANATGSAQTDFERYIQTLVPQMDAEARGAAVRGGVVNAERAARESENMAWEATRGAQVDPAPLADTLDATREGLTMARQQAIAGAEQTINIPRALSTPAGDIPAGPVDVAELNDVRSALLTQQREARSAGDRNRVEALGRFIEDINGYLGSDAVPADVRAATENARAVSANVNERFNRPNDPLAATLSSREGRPDLPDSAVAKTFVQPDSGQASNIDRLLAETDLSSQGRPVREALRDEIVAGIDKNQMAGDPRRLDAYLNNFSRVFDRFPDLREEIRGAADAGRAFNAASAAEDTLRRTLGTTDGTVPGRGAVAEYLRFGNERAETAMNNVVNAADPARAIDDLLTFVGDEPRAVEGARRAFWQVMERTARSKNAAFETADGIEPWMPKKWRTFLDEPKVVAVMDRLYRENPEHAQTLRDIANALQGVQTGAKAGNAINPSGSAQQLRNGPITLAEAQAKFIDVQRGRLNPLYAVTYLAGKIAHRLVSKQAERAYGRLLDEALLNPEVASALLKAENPANRAALQRAAKGWQVYEAAGLTELLSQLGDEPAPEDDDPVISAVMKGAK